MSISPAACFDSYIIYSSDTGGATYCAVASLQLMGFIDGDMLLGTPKASIIKFPLLLEWCLQVSSTVLVTQMYTKNVMSELTVNI